MKIYIPYYDRTWKIQEADSETAREIGSFVKSWLWRGMIYGPTAYTDEQGAQNYINKRYNEARKTEYRPEVTT